MPGSCSSGFSDAPSSGTGKSRSNGFEVSSTNSRKPIETSPRIASTRASSTIGIERPNSATADVQIAWIRHQNNIEPSCPPQTPAMRYISGSVELDVLAAYSTLKSPTTNAQVRQA